MELTPLTCARLASGCIAFLDVSAGSFRTSQTYAIASVPPVAKMWLRCGLNCRELGGLLQESMMTHSVTLRDLDWGNWDQAVGLRGRKLINGLVSGSFELLNQ
jgi:hypothetical protein